MKKIYLARHAQSESNAGLTIRPNPAINITSLGQHQATELAQWLIQSIHEPIDEIFISPYVRTHQTALPFLAQMNKEPTTIDELYEFNYLEYGHIKGLTFPELLTMADEFWERADLSYKDGIDTDSYEEFVERVFKVRAFFESLPDGVYVAFGHGMWIGMLLWQLLQKDKKRILNMKAFRQFELSIRPKNCEVYLLTLDKEQSITKIRSRNEHH